MDLSWGPRIISVSSEQRERGPPSLRLPSVSIPRGNFASPAIVVVQHAARVTLSPRCQTQSKNKPIPLSGWAS